LGVNDMHALLRKVEQGFKEARKDFHLTKRSHKLRDKI
jgi:hypothetical protein